MRIAIVYDCLYPHTVGGAERWYRALAERLSSTHEITYLTRRQWKGDDPGTSFPVVVVAPGGALYTRSGRRRIWPPLRFGLGIFWHLLRHGARYDVVHSASFPYFSLIGAWLALQLRRGARLVVDWHEVWSRDYWLEYLGPVRGRIGYAVQRLCVLLPDHSFTFSRMHEARLRDEGHRAAVLRLTGEYASSGGRVGQTAKGVGEQALLRAKHPPIVLFAGRHIPEKGVLLVPDVVGLVRRRLRGVRCIIFGDGPERAKVEARIRALGLEEVIDVPGRVLAERVHEAMGEASCLLLPSRREGYGLVVVEAASRGTPTVVVDGPDNAATELVEHGVNGLVVASADPSLLAAAVCEIAEKGDDLRGSTLAWYRRQSARLSIESSLDAVERVYTSLREAA